MFRRNEMRDYFRNVYFCSMFDDKDKTFKAKKTVDLLPVSKACLIKLPSVVKYVISRFVLLVM